MPNSTTLAAMKQLHIEKLMHKDLGTENISLSMTSSSEKAVGRISQEYITQSRSTARVVTALVQNTDLNGKVLQKPQVLTPFSLLSYLFTTAQS